MNDVKDFTNLYGFETTITTHELLYGPPPERLAIKTGRIGFLVILFIIGLVVVLNKKITKRTKIIVMSVLTVIAALGLVLLEYLKTLLE